MRCNKVGERRIEAQIRAKGELFAKREVDPGELMAVTIGVGRVETADRAARDRHPGIVAVHVLIGRVEQHDRRVVPDERIDDDVSPNAGGIV